MRVTIILLLTTLVSLNVQLMAAAQSGCETSSQRRIAETKTLPNLGVEYARVTVLKLTSHKTAYRLGELMSLDVAIMNNSDERIFLDDLAYAEFEVHNTKKQEFLLLPYVSVERNVLPGMFSILGPHKFDLRTVYVLVGCDSRAAKMQDVLLNETVKQREIFEKGVFTSWGWGCLGVNDPGTYTIRAKLFTNHVVVSPAKPNLKTAIGTIMSEPLAVSITR